MIRTMFVHIVRGAALGLVVLLAIGGRLLMRVMALMEGRPPLSTVGGSFTVVMDGTIAGALAGMFYGRLWRLARVPWNRPPSPMTS